MGWDRWQNWPGGKTHTWALSGGNEDGDDSSYAKYIQISPHST